jgi:hypothetical protein
VGQNGTVTLAAAWHLGQLQFRTHRLRCGVLASAAWDSDTLSERSHQFGRLMAWVGAPSAVVLPPSGFAASVHRTSNETSGSRAGSRCCRRRNRGGQVWEDALTPGGYKLEGGRHRLSFFVPAASGVEALAENGRAVRPFAVISRGLFAPPGCARLTHASAAPLFCVAGHHSAPAPGLAFGLVAFNAALRIRHR